MPRFESKKPSEKLVTVFSDIENGIIKNTVISGDFFIYPEEAVYLLQDFFNGLDIRKIDYKILNKDIERFIEKNEMELVGISAETLAEAIIYFADGING